MRQDYKAKGDRDRGNIYVGAPKQTRMTALDVLMQKTPLKVHPKELGGGCSKGLDAFRFLLRYTVYTKYKLLGAAPAILRVG